LQVSDADVVQELQALTDLTEHQPGDAALLLRDRLLERQRPLERAPCREPGELVDRHPGHQHGPRLGPQPRPLALRTRPERHVLLDLLAGEVRVGLPVAALEPGHDPLELGGVRTAAPEAVAIRDLDSIAVGPIEEELARLLRQLLPRRLEIDSVALRDRLGELVVVVRSAHGAIAPSPIESVGSGTTRSGSISICEPKPVQRGQAPCGELNEKIRGSSSARLGPWIGQANFSLNKSVWPDCESTSSISTRPSASATAVSIESARRLRSSGFITSRSTTTAMSCLNFLSSTISSSRRRSSPSTFTRLKPSARSSWSCFPYSPLRPRTIGAMTMKRVPSPSSITWSMICSADWPLIGRPQTWQWGWPIRAHSRRR